MSGIDELRVDLARARGLPDTAVSFLQGGTVAELEAQADTLAGLLGTTHAQREPEPPAPNPFAIAAAQKEQRKRELTAMFTGRAPQPRDPAGRFATASFDGGARQPVQAPRDAMRAYGELITQLAAVRRVGGSDSDSVGERFGERESARGRDE